MYVSKICAEGFFVTFPWWLEYVKSRSKIALFSNERHFEIWFPKKRTIAFFWSKLSKLHKKDPILHVATTFPPKQGETRTSHGPIPHPLTWQTMANYKRQKLHTFEPTPKTKCDFLPQCEQSSVCVHKLFLTCHGTTEMISFLFLTKVNKVTHSMAVCSI